MSREGRAPCNSPSNCSFDNGAYLPKIMQGMFKVLGRESLWLAPFLCIGLLSFGLLRPLPHFPLPPQSRTVVDITGTPVHIALPFRGIVLAPNSFPATYLEDTR